jgi:hypothetical protein
LIYKYFNVGTCTGGNAIPECDRVNQVFKISLLSIFAKNITKSRNVMQGIQNANIHIKQFNPLAPSDPYMGRTAQLTSRRCILNIYSTNIRTEYFNP